MRSYKNILKDTKDAAQKLKDVIPMHRFKDEEWHIVALSKGGLEIGSYLREDSSNSIDFLFSHPIVAPHNDDCEIARVSESEEIIIHEALVSAFEINYDYIYSQAHLKHEDVILSEIYRYRKGRPFSDLRDKIVLLVDEGSETGSRLLLGIKSVLAQKPKAVYLAVGVLPGDVLENLKQFVDNIFFLYSIDDYVNTSLYYEKLEDIDDERVENLLED